MFIYYVFNFYEKPTLTELFSIRSLLTKSQKGGGGEEIKNLAKTLIKKLEKIQKKCFSLLFVQAGSRYTL